MDGSKAIIGSGTEDSIKVSIYKGVRQGCPLGPLLFITVLASLLKEVDAHEVPYKFKFAFADDTTFLSNNRKDLVKVLEFFKEYGPKYGLMLHEGKTEWISCYKDHGKKLHPNKPLSYQYHDEAILLGSHVGKLETTIDLRIKKAQLSFYALLDPLLRRNEISSEIKIRVFKAVCISTLLFGLESVTITPKMEGLMDSFAFRCYKIILGLYYNKDEGRISREYVYGILQRDFEVLKPSLMLQKLRIKNFLHFQRNSLKDERDIFNYCAMSFTECRCAPNRKSLLCFRDIIDKDRQALPHLFEQSR
jgi:hypothetical protein